MAIKPKPSVAAEAVTRRAAIAAALQAHGHLPNVTGLDYGRKITRGVATDEDAIIVYVDRKFATPAEVAASGSRTIPSTIEVDGRMHKVDIVEASFRLDGVAAGSIERMRRQNPVCPGISVGNIDGLDNAGTIGAIVVHQGTGFLAIMSCQHVIARNYADDRINQPGRPDDPGYQDPGRFEPDRSNLGRLLGLPLLDEDGDAAIAQIVSRRVRREIEGLGVAIEAVADPKPGDIVVKSGRTSGVTFGKIVSLDHVSITPDSAIGLHGFSIAPLDGAPWPITKAGDSGAAWMLCRTVAGKPVATTTMVGLHYGASDTQKRAYAAFATKLFDRLDIRPSTADDIARHAETLELATSAVLFDAPAPTMVSVFTHVVIGRHGARLRPTPAVRAFEDRLLPTGTQLLVRGMSDHGDGRWAEVDLEGDGLVDGFVHSRLLMDRNQPLPLLPLPTVLTPESVIDRLTPALVAKLFDNLPFVRANIVRFLPHIIGGLRDFGLTDIDMILVALGTIKAETAAFEPISEHRSSFNSVVVDFDQYEPGTSKGADLGNKVAGDGARFRGRGFVQLTGRDNYDRIGSRLSVPLVSQPELANDPAIAGRILAAFLDRKQALLRADLKQPGDAGLKQARRRVNGGIHGFDRFKAVMEQGRPLLG